MSLTLGREGGIAEPLKKRTVGQINQCYVGTQGGKADDGKTSIGEIKYTKLNKIGELTIYSPIES